MTHAEATRFAEVLTRLLLPGEKLSRREAEVAWLVGSEGLNYAEIAIELGVSADTARTYFDRLAGKCGRPAHRVRHLLAVEYGRFAA